MNKITQRQIIGRYYKALAASAGRGWAGMVANYFASDQASEEYAWLGQSPAFREWVGGRNAQTLRESAMTIINKHYESTLDIPVRHLRRDHTGQIDVRIDEQARRSNTHWMKLLSTLIVNGPSTDCYDGQYFFDTDHSEGDSGTQSNDISVDISALPASVSGTVTAPSVEEMDGSIAEGIAAIVGFKDDTGEPMNEDAAGFLVMTPNSLFRAALQAVVARSPAGYPQTTLEALREVYNISVIPNVRLDANSWTDEFCVFRTDANVRPFIMQEEVEPQMKAKAEGSEYEFDNDAHQYGVDMWRNVGYGYWQMACLVTMT